MEKILFSLIFIVLQFVALSQESNKIYCELHIKQKNVTVKTDYFTMSFYDNVKSWNDVKSTGLATGYQAKLVFIVEDVKRDAVLRQFFYNGAECFVIFRFWDEYLFGTVNIFKIEPSAFGVVTINVESKSELKRITQKMATWKARFR